MAKARMVLIADTLSAEKRDKVTEDLRKMPEVGFWHWFPDAWLISDTNGRSLEWWRDHVHELLPAESFLLIPTQTHSRAGYLTADQWKWLDEGNWN